MYCDRSAYYQKAIKATARRLIINTNLLWLFLLFGRLVFETDPFINIFDDCVEMGLLL
jgi:TM2 domain-containing membrane protein YozV